MSTVYPPLAFCYIIVEQGTDAGRDTRSPGRSDSRFHRLDRRTSLEEITMNDRPTRVVACACASLVGLAFLLNSATAADGPQEQLHVRIDRLMDADRIGPPIALASDPEFLRRVSLD